MCNCSGECCVCACGGCCLAGNGDDDFTPASKQKIIDNLENNRYPRYREYMIKYLKEKYGIDYIENEESEESKMLHKVTVTKTEEKVMEEYWVIRELRSDIVITPIIQKPRMRELDHKPSKEEIAQFLSDSDVKVATVEHNYRFVPDLPFE